jgi:cytochrome c2
MIRRFCAACIAMLALCGCSRLSSRRVTDAHALTGGNARAGRLEIREYGCETCHTIAGVPGAGGLVGPPLDGIGDRSYIAGDLPNTPENLERWIEHPLSIKPDTVMPEMNVNESDSRDIASYLYTLR